MAVVGNKLYQKARQKMSNPQTGDIIASLADNGGGKVRVTTTNPHGLFSGGGSSATVTIVNASGGPSINGFALTATRVGTNSPGTDVTFDLTSISYTSGYTANSGELLFSDAQQKTNPMIIRWGIGTSGVGYGDDIRAALINVNTNDTVGIYYDVLSSGGGGSYRNHFNYIDEFLSDVLGTTGTNTTGGTGVPPLVLSYASAFSTKAVSTTDSPLTGPEIISPYFAVNGGIVSAANVVFSVFESGVVSGQSAEALVIYKWTGDARSSPLIAYIDTATGLPVTTNGASITVSWDTGTNRIFSI